MNRQQIETRLRKVCGKNAYYEVRNNAPDADGRAALGAAHKKARLDKEEAQKRMNDRTSSLQAADPEYQAALQAWKDAGKRMRDAGGFDSYRINAGTATRVGGLGMFNVRARGDTWAEVFDKLETAL